jgi:hypothetical protein
MANLTKSVSAFTIKKATFNLNEYNPSYSNSPLYRMIENMIEQKVKQAEFEGVPAQVFNYFYDKNDFRSVGEIETYYISGYKNEYNMCDIKKPMLAKFIYNRLIIAFNNYLSTTLYNTNIEEYQKLCVAIDTVYNSTGGDINKSIRLLSELWDFYCMDDSLETNWDVRDKITEGFQQSSYYQNFVSEMGEMIQRRFDIKKDNAASILFQNMLGDKVKQLDTHYGKSFQAQLEAYNQLQSEILELKVYE